MGSKLREAVPRAAICGFDRPAGFKLFNGKRAWSVVLGGNGLESVDDFLIFSLPEQIFGGLLEPDHRHSKNAENKHQGAVGVPDVTPTLQSISLRPPFSLLENRGR